MRIPLFVAAVLTVSAALGCASRVEFPERPARRSGNDAPGPDGKALAAEIVGKPVTIGELDADIADQLAAARTTYEMALYEARKGALDQRIEQALLQTEAGKRGMSVEALLAAEIDAKVSAPTDAETQAFYDQYKDQMDGAPFEAMSERIREHLRQERKGSRRNDFLGELRKRHGVKVLLDPPRVEVEAKGPARGPDNAKVTIVIFSDFECPFCGRAEPTLAKIRETYPKDVRFVFRNYPLPFHQSARPAAIAAVCAGEQGKFWELHDQMFASGELGSDAIHGFLGKLGGFDLAKFDDCVQSGRGEAVIESDVAAAGTVGVDSTPHFFVNGVRVSGAQPFEAFQSIIDSELSR